MLFFLLHTLYHSICNQVSNQADQSNLLMIILLLADVSPTYSSELPQGNCPRTGQCEIHAQQTR